MCGSYTNVIPIPPLTYAANPCLPEIYVSRLRHLSDGPRKRPCHDVIDDKVMRLVVTRERVNKMNGKRYGSGANRVTELYGEFGAIALQRQEWQRTALKQAETRRALRASGPNRSAKVGAGRRAIAIVGSAIVRFGLRLQGQTRISAAGTAQ